MVTKNPDWRSLVDQAMAERQKSQDRRSLAINIPPEWQGMINRAAAGREMTLTAFLRRSMMAFVAHDLGLDYFTIMEGEPTVVGFDRKKHKSRGSGRGRGHGLWEIEYLKGEDHDHH